MKNIKDIYDLIFEEKKPSKSTGKIVLKSVLITGAVLAFVPTVFKINKGEGFDGYGLLSRLSFKKRTDENGRARYDWYYSLIDLERYGAEIPKESNEENEALSEMAELDAFEEAEAEKI